MTTLSPSSNMLPLLLLLTVVIAPASSATTTGLRVELTHVDAMKNLTSLELLRRAVQRSRHRLSNIILLTKTTSPSLSSVRVPVPIHAGSTEYIMDLAIGTPAVPFPAILDTGSDLTWTQCQPCVTCFDQPAPFFEPSKSSTYAQLSCRSKLCDALPNKYCSPNCFYLYDYQDSSYTRGDLASETFRFGSVSVPGVGFGCGFSNRGNAFPQAAGIVGLGRGNLSLVSQLSLLGFSYCFAPFAQAKKSTLLMGSFANLGATAGPVKSTPLARNPAVPTFYYLNLTGISVGETLLPIPSSTFALDSDGNGGTIIDTGTTLTMLAAAGYEPVARAFKSQVGLPPGNGSAMNLGLCFQVPPDAEVDLPKLVFHFDGANWELPQKNYFEYEPATGVLCLMLLKSERRLSVFGNFQQQNFNVVYDLEKEKLSFEPARCGGR